mmetsp:Transcript_16592/g.31431  ORF Transcript_16592/g.31431 Transcript_16592/m.31431 type:complete len:805 (+) Transcript_16592:127-2541(+)
MNTNKVNRTMNTLFGTRPPKDDDDDDDEQDGSAGTSPRQDDSNSLSLDAIEEEQDGDNISDLLSDKNKEPVQEESRPDKNKDDNDKELQALISKVQTLEDKIASIEEGGSRRPRKKSLVELSDRVSREEKFDDDGILGLSAHSYEDQDDDYSSLSIPQAIDYWMPEEDTYTAMMFAPGCCSLVYFLGLFVFAAQLVLGHAILFDQLNETNSIVSVFFDVPTNVSDLVYVGQFFGLFMAMLFSRDMFTAITVLDRFWFYKIEEKNPRMSFWCNVFYPNIFRFAQGLFILFISFIAVIQSENILDLFKAFTALVLVTEMDAFAFKIAKQGYFGGTIESQIKAAMYDRMVGAEATFRKIEFARKMSSDRMICCGSFSRKMFFAMILLGLGGGWGYFVNEQRSGKIFKEKHPFCNVSKEQRGHYGDGVCDGSTLNTYQCNFDGGDCMEFNVAYPLCDVEKPSLVGNGVCDGGDYDTERCGNDGGDCCKIDPNDPQLGDGKCHSGIYNTRGCRFDNGDCLTFNRRFPNCIVESPFLVGDGVCHGGDYNTLDCGWDSGDCEPPVPTVGAPSSSPSLRPSTTPTGNPSDAPSISPTDDPSVIPSSVPSIYPSDQPSSQPSVPCVDEPGWQSGGKGFMPLGGTTCAQMGNRTSFCDIFMSDSRYFFAGKAVHEACCLCGGSDLQTIAPSESPSFKPTVSSSPSMVPSIQPSLSFHPTVNSNVPSATPTFITAPPSECIDEPDWKVVIDGFAYEDLGCDSIAGVDSQGNDFNNCDDAFTENYPVNDENGKVAETACCACGGGSHVAPVPFRAV